jgi:hypothetical protein
MLNTLRNKPEHVRKNIALIGSIVITSIIAASWLYATFNVESSVPAPSAASVSEGEVQTPFTVVKDLFSDLGKILQSDKKKAEGVLQTESQ